MSKYTTEVRFICETAAGYTESVGYDLVEETIQKAIPKVFNFGFPIFDESYRNVLCTKILKHYYTREICEETVGLWKLRLETRMNEIMPYYNQLYKSELLEFNPLYDVDLTTKHDAEKEETLNKTEGQERENTWSDTTVNNGTTSNARNLYDEATTKNTGTTSTTNNSTTTNDGVSRDLYSDTPQGALTGVESENYLTNARKVSDNKSEQRNDTATGSSTNDTNYKDSVEETNNGQYSDTTNRNTNEKGKLDIASNSKLNSMDGYIQTVVGKTGGVSYSKMLDEFRKTFLNIDMMVIDELKDLFFGLW